MALETGFITYADATAMNAATVTAAMVDRGAEAKLTDTGAVYRAMARGSGAGCWLKLTPASISRGFVEAISSTDNTIPGFNGTAGQLENANALSGNWTPTIVNGSNVTASASLRGDYIQVFDRVFFSVTGSFTHTAGAPTASAFSFSLPVASNLAATTDLIGTVSGPQVSLASVAGNATDNDADVSYSIAATGAQLVQITGSYRVL